MSSLLQYNQPTEKNPVAVMKTNMGDITIMFFPEKAPKTVENFLTHAKNGYYNGVIFHRIIKDFMIQGGDPNGTGMGGQSIWGKSFEDEFSGDLFHFYGAVSMANAGPNTNGSQFFIVQNSYVGYPKEAFQKAGYPDDAIDAYIENGGTPHLDGKHTVFGQVIDGLDVVENIANTKVDPADKPMHDVVIESITIK